MNVEQNMFRTTLLGTALGAVLMGGLTLIGKGQLGCYTIGAGSLGGALLALFKADGMRME